MSTRLQYTYTMATKLVVSVTGLNGLTEMSTYTVIKTDLGYFTKQLVIFCLHNISKNELVQWSTFFWSRMYREFAYFLIDFGRGFFEN